MMQVAVEVFRWCCDTEHEGWIPFRAVRYTQAEDLTGGLAQAGVQ
jgi:hypothetical protein